jgi:hypothetical protein
MDPLLICYPYVTAMDPLLICYLYVTAMDTLLLCYPYVTAMDPLLICYLYVTAMDTLLLCYLYVTAMDPLLICYLLNAFACVVVCFCMWVYLRSAYKHKYAREYAELIMWNEIRDKQVREYQVREIRMKKIHDEYVEIVKQVKEKIAKETEDRLSGKIKSLESQLADLRRERDDLRSENIDVRISWLHQIQAFESACLGKAHVWAAELLPTSQAGSP